ncbi:MAG: alpha-2-macroglobulin [Verrucomicrobia bacterium]|nr:alpha-2-macroglobulin [Verrucomicrobiota bacterium]
MSSSSFLRRSASAASGLARRSLRACFGEISWRPPAWLRALAAAPQRHPAASAVVALLLPALGVGAWQARQWARSRPQPRLVEAKMEAPRETRFVAGKPLQPLPLEVRFSAPVARLDKTSRTVREGVRLDPPLPGAWEWVNDSALVFRPTEDWPADTTLRVTLEPSLFAPGTRLPRNELSARTAPLTVKFEQAMLYQDPRDPSVKQITATILASHPVALAEVEKSLQLKVLGESAVLRPTAAGAAFTLAPGEHQRQFFLRSANVALPEREDFVRLELPAGLPALKGGARTASAAEAKVRIPDLYSYFAVQSARGLIVNDKAGDPGQVLLVETTVTMKPEQFAAGVELFLLPARNPRIVREAPTPTESESSDEDEEGSRRRERDSDEDDSTEGEARSVEAVPEVPAFDEWKAGEVTDEVLAASEKVALTLVPSAEPLASSHAFRFRTAREGLLFVRVKKGLKAAGGYLLRNDFFTVLETPLPPQGVEIQGEGGVLALTGERKLSLRSRGLQLIEYEIAQVPADQINHLVSQTSGSFSDPEFRSGSFTRENLARIATERQPVAMKNRSEADFLAFDLSKHLQAPGSEKRFRQGLFFLKARGLDPKSLKPVKGAEVAGRFLLVTDLGLIVKANADGTREVFVASLKSRQPAAGVTVDILARNGLVVATATTGADGRAALAAVDKLERDRKPVAIVARRGDDTAFLPYAARDRGLDFSLFDTGGVQAKSGAELDGFLFTERGVYRPGDAVRIGALLHRRDWQPAPEGVPLEIEVIDPAGTKSRVTKLALPSSGFAEASYATTPDSPTGDYTLRLHLLKEGKRSGVLGEERFWVKEFLPDTMRIEAKLSQPSARGWVTPAELKANVSLQNLYGIAASDRRLKAQLELSPSGFSFPEYEGWRFFDPLQDRKGKKRELQTVELGERQTDAQGAGEFPLELGRFADATYALTFRVEGFEAESGRSVSALAQALVSPLAFVAGWKADGELGAIQAGADRTLRFLALDRQLNRVASGPLKLQLIQRVFLSTLTKAENGNYRYESVRQERELSSQAVEIGVDGWSYALPTREPGEFELRLLDAQERAVAVVGFGVVGAGRGTRSMDKNAELQLKLARKEFKAGDVVEIGISAPYTGCGLITLEREKVFAHAWFRADETSSVQRLRIPDDFDGSGYLNVCFVRALDSKEIYASPLSYAVQPIKVNRAARRLPIELTTAASARPGEALVIRHRTPKPARIAVFAVDKGILQVSDYQLPDPLSHFFRQVALATGTTQFLDQLLPEFSVLRAMAATGGGDEAAPKTLNPFRRVTDEPVVFWSGVVETGPEGGSVTYQVPDSFNGTLAVMAVALAADAVGAAETKSLVRGSFVINPSVPTMAAPGDEFEAGVTLANNVDGSGEQAPVALKYELSEHLEFATPPPAELKVSEGRETAFTVRLRVRDALGSALLTIRASSASGEESRARATLSVRPATPFRVQLRSGSFRGASQEVPVERALYPQFRRAEATVSALPLGLARGLERFLREYPHGCTEQLTSGALARLALQDDADFGLPRAEVAEMVARVCATLRLRQGPDGGFGYWAPGATTLGDPTTVHAVLFLLEAKAAGFAPPEDLLQRALGCLRQLVAREPTSLRDARHLAAAIHLLTREGVVTTNYVLNLRDWLTRRFPDGSWQRDLAAVHLAAALALLKKSDEAGKLIAQYRLGAAPSSERWDFHSSLVADAQYAAVLAAHFPALLQAWKAEDLECLVKPISTLQYNTYSAAYAVLALRAYARLVKAAPPVLAIREANAAGQFTALALEGSPALRRAGFTAGAKELRFESNAATTYYQVIEAGYDLRPPAEGAAAGLEVTRELLTPKGEPLGTVRLGDPVLVRIKARTQGGTRVDNVAIVDLLPCGFEIADKSIEPGARQRGCDFVEVREDRVVLFGPLTPAARTIEYRIKPTARGSFVVPPIAAESMYDRSLNARGATGRLTVVAP